MKKALIALAAATAVGTVSAQTNKPDPTSPLSITSPSGDTTFTISGKVSLGYRDFGAAAKPVYGIVRTGNDGNNLTFNVLQKLGDDYTAGVLLNIRFDSANGLDYGHGSISNNTSPGGNPQLFENVKVSMNAPWGQIAGGRFNLGLDTVRVYVDNYRPEGLGVYANNSPLDYQGRENASVQYSTPEIAGFKGTYAIANGKQQPIPTNVNYYEYSLSYNHGGLSIGGGRNHNDGVGTNGQNIAGKDDTIFAVGYDFGYFKAGEIFTRTTAYRYQNINVPATTPAVTATLANYRVPESTRHSISLRAPIPSSKFEWKYGWDHEQIDGHDPVNYMASGFDYFVSRSTRTILSLEAGKQYSHNLVGNTSTAAYCTNPGGCLSHRHVTYVANFTTKF